MKFPILSRIRKRPENNTEDAKNIGSTPGRVTGSLLGKGIKQYKKLLVLALVAVLTLLAIVTSIGITKFGKKQDSKEADKKAPILVVDGQEYTADYLISPPDDTNFTKETPTLDQYIHEGEEAIALGRADYEVFVTLASMYGSRGDIDKALATYKRAKESVDKADPDYDGKIKAIDQNIADLKAGQGR